MARTVTNVIVALGIIVLTLFVSFILLNMPVAENFTISSAQSLMPAVSGAATGSPNLVRQNTVFISYQGVQSFSDSAALLQARQCYQFPQVIRLGVPSTATLDPHDPLDSRAFSCHVDVSENTYSSYSAIESYITTRIQAFRPSDNEKIKGNVYVMITQVPYFVNVRGNPINIGYDADLTTGYWPSGGSSPRLNIFYRIYIIYANYGANNGAYMPSSTFECNVISQFNQKYASNDKQCFIRCMQDNKACGCASTGTGVGVYSDNSNYVATCLGRDQANNDQQTPSTYVILYSVNKTNAAVSSLFKP
jgi:hypothetical protein